mmetsp:Transcript_47753/g.116245  ORF Transcript_47753/g.116245 Transcript_47753/m.116245 type:complete len:86 (+) Transcript_47753:721-978(+)
MNFVFRGSDKTVVFLFLLKMCCDVIGRPPKTHIQHRSRYVHEEKREFLLQNLPDSQVRRRRMTASRIVLVGIVVLVVGRSVPPTV